ncbi:hypothetical protein HPB49_026230 [Dermacentor silvarum]|nr:hypothetical protein HPB49_026230 [Dermacentor silvarum]
MTMLVASSVALGRAFARQFLPQNEQRLRHAGQPRLVRLETAVFEPSPGHECSTDEVLVPPLANTTSVKTSATPPADLPPGDLSLTQHLETTAAPSAPLCNEASIASLKPATAIPSLSVPLPPSSDSEEKMDTATFRKCRRECEDGVDDAAPCKQFPPPAAEATTIQVAAVVAEPLRRCVDVAPSSEKAFAHAPGDGVSLGTTAAASQPRPSSSAASAALLTMAPADVFAAVLRDAVTAAPNPATRLRGASMTLPALHRSWKVVSPWSFQVRTVVNRQAQHEKPQLFQLLPRYRRRPTRHPPGILLALLSSVLPQRARPSAALTVSRLLRFPVRVNKRLDTVAVDADSSERLQDLLAMTELAELQLDISGHDLLAAVSSSVPVVSVNRSGDTVTFSFAATSSPACIHLYRMPFPVKLIRPRPVQYAHCGRYGNTTTACVFPERCLRCGGQHCISSCEQQRPRCFDCRGPHPANLRCVRWQEERKLTNLVAAAPGPLRRQEARATVRAEASRATTINGPIGTPRDIQA